MLTLQIERNLSDVLRDRLMAHRAQLAYASHVRRLVRPIQSIASVSIVAMRETEFTGRELIDSQLRRYRRENA